MRASKNEATGTSGESEVLAEFERLGWAGVIDGRHDTGTDLYLRPRDARRFELGVMMGTQVKTGPSYFASPQKNSAGRITGWWFAQDDREHFDYWLHHALPHLVILRDQVNSVSYWVHVTPNRVISTGKGAKVLVPASQTVDQDHNEALADVALTQLPTPNWDGTAWTGARHLSPSEAIRHALITPRLIAPHPNLAPDSITGVEALAMQILVKDKIAEILTMPDFFARPQSDEKWKGLSLDEARGSDDWCWRATAALHIWLYQGNSAELLQLTERVSCPADRAAANALACVHYFAENDPDAALLVLQRALEHDDYSPIDHAWLETQRARALLEIGRDQDAFDLAMKTQRIYREAPLDVTAAAIAGACARISFTATRWMGDGIANIVQRSDNAASWWRTQVMFYGLSGHLSDEFRTWSQDAPTRVGSADSARTNLTAAALLASCAGDLGWWRDTTGALAEHLLTGTDAASDPETVAKQLTLLRHSGDSEGTRRATRRIVARGPAIAARIAANDIDLSRSTRTTALADIRLLTAAGDVIEQTRADQICGWILATLRDPHSYFERVRPTFIVGRELMNLLKSMVWAMSEEALHDMIDYFLDQSPVTDDSTAQVLARLIHEIPKRAWRESDRQRAAARSNDDATYLCEAYLEVAAPTVPESQKEIHRRARAGELIILDAVDDVRALPSDAASALIDTLCASIDTLIGSASIGLHFGGGPDTGKTLTLLNIWHPHQARWDRIEALLTASEVEPHERLGTLHLLAIFGSELSEETKRLLAVPLAELRSKAPGLSNEQDVRCIATEALAALTDETSREALVRNLLRKDAAHRTAAAHIIERFGDKAESEILLALAGDAEATARDASLCGLSKLVATERASEEIAAFLAQVLESSGKQSAAAIVSRLREHPQVPASSKLLTSALRHPSAQVRDAAQQALSRQPSSSRSQETMKIVDTPPALPLSDPPAGQI